MRTLTLCLFFTLLGCATGAAGLMRLQDRELLIHPDKSGLGYPYKEEVCVWKSDRFHWLGKKCHDEQRIDFYDLNDKPTRDRLIAAGFSCKSSMRFKY